jgi:UPF0176 protein
MKKYQILLYYCYTPIADPEEFREQHHLFCVSLAIKGRIIVAAEGLNGTISGTVESCRKYMEVLKADSRFSSIDFKIEDSDKHGFQKLNVRVKSEIVHSGLAHVRPNEKTGIHLEPFEFKKMKEEEDVVILDVRSNYEHKVGRFKNAVTLDLEVSNARRRVHTCLNKVLKMFISCMEESLSMVLKRKGRTLKESVMSLTTGSLLILIR